MISASLATLVALAAWPSTGGPHLFIDRAGLHPNTTWDSLIFKAHSPRKTYTMLVQPEYPWEPYIDAYNSIVQVSVHDLRVYYGQLVFLAGNNENAPLPELI